MSSWVYSFPLSFWDSSSLPSLSPLTISPYFTVIQFLHFYLPVQLPRKFLVIYQVLVLITLAAQSSFYIFRRLCTWWQTKHKMEATLLQDTSKQLCPFLLWCNQHLCQNDEVVKPAYYPFKLQKTSSWNDPSWVKTSWNSASALKLTLWWLWLMVFVTLGCPLDALSDKGELNIYPNGRGIKAGWWVTVM